MDILSFGFAILCIGCFIAYLSISDMGTVVYASMKGQINLVRGLIACVIMICGPLGFIFYYGFVSYQAIWHPYILGAVYGIAFSIPFLLPKTKSCTYDAMRIGVFSRLLWLVPAGALFCYGDYLMNERVYDYGWLIVPSVSFGVFCVMGCGLSASLQAQSEKAHASEKKASIAAICAGVPSGFVSIAIGWLESSKKALMRR